MAQLIKNALDHKLTNIAVWPLSDDNQSPVANAMRAINRFIRENRDHSSDYTAKVMTSLRNALLKNIAHVENTAAIETIEALAPHTPHKIFFLSNAIKGQQRYEKLKAEVPGQCASLSTDGLWSAIVDSGFAIRAGFQGPIAVTGMRDDICQQFSDQDQEPYYKDSAHAHMRNTPFTKTDRPFLNSLTELAKTLPAAFAPATTWTPGSVKPAKPSRVEAFGTKWGGKYGAMKKNTLNDGDSAGEGHSGGGGVGDAPRRG